VSEERTEQVDRLELALDERLSDVRTMLINTLEQEVQPDTLCVVGALFRWAYARGLMDALDEPVASRDFVASLGYATRRPKVRP
jgi:hypothetical protein